jgi:diguanylate cyclase (GGDEF)-like protein
MLASLPSIAKLRDAFDDSPPFELCEPGGSTDESFDVAFVDDVVAGSLAGGCQAWCRIALTDDRCESDAAISETADAATWRHVSTLAIEIACLRQEIGTLRRHADRLHSQAHSDPLTSLANRRGWDEAFADRAELGSLLHTTIAILDLDRFKSCNDRYGHDFGDRVLVATANWLKQSLRQSDLVARIGGDEFAVRLDGMAEADVPVIVERIRGQVCEGLSAEFAEAAPTVSLGACSGPSREFKELQSAADQALMRAKGAGRNRSDSVVHGE